MHSGMYMSAARGVAVRALCRCEGTRLLSLSLCSALTATEIKRRVPPQRHSLRHYETRVGVGVRCLIAPTPTRGAQEAVATQAQVFGS
jgi:hypothetical protein